MYGEPKIRKFSQNVLRKSNAVQRFLPNYLGVLSIQFRQSVSVQSGLFVSGHWADARIGQGRCFWCWKPGSGCVRQRESVCVYIVYYKDRFVPSGQDRRSSSCVRVLTCPDVCVCACVISLSIIVRKINRFWNLVGTPPVVYGQEWNETLRENALFFYVSAYKFLFKFSRQPSLLLRTCMQ